MGKSNIIEINGRRYDARTGEPLDAPAAAGAMTRAAASYHKRLSTKPTQPRAVHAAQLAPVQAAVVTKQTSKIRVHDAVKARPQSRRQQHSTTLMRSAVAKPAKSLRRRIKVQSPADLPAIKSAARLQRKTSVRRIDEKRLRHARTAAKSQAVSRFSRPHGPHEPSLDPPVHLPARQPKPAEFPASHPPVAPQLPERASRTLDGLNDLVEHALQQAVSHLESAPAAPKRRLFWRFSD